MKNKFNILRKYILEASMKEYRKETINGLFRSVLTPLISNQKLSSCVLLKLNYTQDKESLLKRLLFSESCVFSYNDNLLNLNLANSQIDDIWDTTEFVIILSQRYSAALIWDYDLSDKENYTNVCFLYNSKIISDIAKKIAENSSADIMEYIKKYSPDRRENQVLNSSINALADLFNDKNEEIIFSENEKQKMYSNDDTLKTADIIAKKAKFIAHEIKNNLSIVNLYTAIAEKRFENFKSNEEVINSIKNSFKNITSASENISSLINDLRCLSAPYKTELSIKNLILNTVDMCREKADKENINIYINDFMDRIILTDKTKFQCALTNIIFNAVEACKPYCSIYIDCYIDMEYVRVQIKNNGEKIPQDIQNKIFEPDFTTKSKGNGLGLSICRKQIELIGGNINLVSSDENETIFEIILPL